MLPTDEEKHSVLSTESFVPYVMDVYTSARSKDVVVHLISPFRKYAYELTILHDKFGSVI